MALPENDEGSQWKKKTDNKRFAHARAGDMLSSSFQCEICWFINLKRREPVRLSAGDQRLLGYSRRVNLDIMWSHEKSTVGNTLSALKKAKELSEELGLTPQIIELDPWPVSDDVGFQTALEMLRASQREGKNVKEYVQFDTVRKICTSYATVYENSARGGAMTACFKGDHGRTFALNNGGTDTRLFRKFIAGLERRMGRVVRQNSGIAIDVLLKVFENYEGELSQSSLTKERRREIIMAGAGFA